MTEEKFLPTVLVIDDNQSVIESFKVALDNYNVLATNSGEIALDKIKKEDINVVLLDILMPGMDGMDVLRKIKELDKNIDVIMVTAIKTVKTAIEAMKLGAYDYITKPFDVDELLESIRKAIERQGLLREVEYLKSELSPPFMFDDIVGSDENMKKVYDMITDVAKGDTTVLINGESGTGKELVARSIHFHSPRKDRPFVTVDCASIPENLLESELFGHERGAFTDATTQKLGRFELANTGTLFLDEISNMDMAMQGKILRAIQEREIQRLGSQKTIKIDIRIISATNIDLKKAVKENAFREDLYYRLNVIPLSLPPLRERKSDIPMLANYFLQMYSKMFNKDIQDISKQAMNYLIDYNWPGNVRELQNITERLVTLGKEKIISHKRLPLDILISEEKGIKPKKLFKGAVHQFETQYILGVLEKTNWNQTNAAKLLNIHRNTLIWKINLLGLRKFQPKHQNKT
ncbi:MAG: hypothetical protein COY53_00480 [Elusimicrobia bacterium CG_4_10_14_0_8_um_filter_37_32]|nr:MAG: hypothetical protein COY53_00480 [Elusimicrobia bacterium CG_4_10_14_0_8_um_filter_37_32]